MAVVQDTAQNKLLLLFVFDKMEIPLSEETLLDFCTASNKWINYMECKDAVNQLLSAGFIHKSASNSGGEVLYAITAEGRVCLAHFFVRIPATLREEVSESIKESRMSYRRKQEYSADYIKNSDGTYEVILKILEPNSPKPAMELHIKVPNRNTAKWIYSKWEERAIPVYSAVYDMLSDLE